MAKSIKFEDYLGREDFAEALGELAGDLNSRLGLPTRVDEVGLVCPNVLLAARELEARVPGMSTFVVGEGSPKVFKENGRDVDFTTRVAFAMYKGVLVELAEPGVGSEIFGQTENPKGQILVNHLGYYARGPNLERHDPHGSLQRWSEIMSAAGFARRFEATIRLMGLCCCVSFYETRRETADVEIEFLDLRLFSPRGPKIDFPAFLGGALGWIQKHVGPRFIRLGSKQLLPPAPSAAGPLLLPPGKIEGESHLRAIQNLTKNPRSQEAADRLIELAHLKHAESSSRPEREMSAAAMLRDPSAPKPERIVRPRSFDELAEAVGAAIAAEKPIKPVSGGNALSDANFTHGWRIDLGAHLNRVARVTHDLRDDAPKIYEIESGATIQEVNDALAEDGCALFNQPGFEGLTFVGAASAGGHGSGINLGPLANYICAVRAVIVEQGRVRRVHVEPDPGVTRAKHGEIVDGYEVIRDTRVFKAFCVGIGGLACIYSVYVKVRDFYFLEETRTFHEWKDLRDKIPQLLADPNYHSIAIWLNPYSNEAHPEPTCLLSTYRELSGPARGERAFGLVFGGSNTLSNMIVWFVEHSPIALPVLLDSALRAAAQEKGVTMPCTQALNFGPPNNLAVTASAFGIDADRTIEAVDFICEFADQAIKNGACITSPIGLRFTAPGEGLISMQQGRATCMIEVPMLQGTDFASSTLDALVEAMAERFSARPHWGQRIRLKKEQFEKVYPQLGEFRDVAKSLGIDRLYSNDFLRRLGF